MQGSKAKKGYLQFFLELLEVVLIAFALSWFAKTYLLGLATVPDNAMLPTLGKDNKVLVLKPLALIGDYKTGDILVYEDLAKKKQTKRVIAVGGDKIEIRNGFVYLNGKPLYEPYAQTPLTYTYPEVRIPQGQVFVLGDNRSDLNDARALESISVTSVNGRAIFCYWSLSRFSLLLN